MCTTASPHTHNMQWESCHSAHTDITSNMLDSHTFRSSRVASLHWLQHAHHAVVVIVAVVVAIAAASSHQATNSTRSTNSRETRQQYTTARRPRGVSLGTASAMPRNALRSTHVVDAGAAATLVGKHAVGSCCRNGRTLPSGDTATSTATSSAGADASTELLNTSRD
jgi:hypothetical protein